MILKIERHNKTQKWWLIDNLAKVSCSKNSKYSQTVTPSLLDEGDDIVILDHNPECSCGENEGCSQCKTYYRLICRLKDHTEFGIVFDTVVYICNDEGKTIEKIVANYQE